MRRLATSPRLPFIMLMAATALLFLAGLGRLPLFGRDESLYAEAGREMLATGDWITPRVNGGPFFEKPPLYYWLAAMSYRLVGVSPFAARLPAALMAILTVGLTALVGANVWGRRAGLLTGLCLATSLQMATIGRMGIMDVPLTCFTVLALLCYARWQRRGQLGAAVGFSICAALAVLVKGMAGTIALGIAAIAYVVRVVRGTARPVSWLSAARAMVAIVVLVGLALPWFASMGARHGEAFGTTLFIHEHLKRALHPMQGHGGPLIYYLVVIAVTFFPWVMFLPAAMISAHHDTDETKRFWGGLSIIWIAYVLVLFSFVRTKLPGYVTPLFPPMALLVGAELDHRLDNPARKPWIAAIGSALGLAAALALLPRLADRLAVNAGAAEALPMLTPPVLVWSGGYLVMVLGAALALVRRPYLGLAAMTAGQIFVLGAVLWGIFPLLSPYLEGGRESRLAQMAQRRLPGARVVLYETRPEAVAFVLQQSVPVFDGDHQDQLLTALRAGPTALIAPTRDRPLWEHLSAREIGTVGDRVLLEVPPIKQPKEASP